MTDKALRVSYGEYTYESVPGWAPLPEGWEWNHVVGVVVDSQDRIFAYNRSDHPMIVLSKDGDILDTWHMPRIYSVSGRYQVCLSLWRQVCDRFAPAKINYVVGTRHLCSPDKRQVWC